MTHTAPSLILMDYVGPVMAAVVFIALMSLVRGPTRRTVNAIIAAGALGVYLNGGFGPYEFDISHAIAFHLTGQRPGSTG